MASTNRGYVAGFFPTDDSILAKHSVWSNWFLVKQKLIDSKMTSIDKWVDNGIEEAEITNGEEFEAVEGYDSSVGSDIMYKPSPKCSEVKENNNLQQYTNHKTTIETMNLIKNYYADIVSKRLVKWQENGLDRLLLPASKKITSIPEIENDCFDNWNSFKRKVTIKETRTISIICDSGTDSVDTADYIRGARGKGKSIPGENKNRLIKKYSYVKEIESSQPYGVKGNKIVQRFPLDSDSDSPRKSKKKSNESQSPLKESGRSPRHISIKMKRKRLPRQSKLTKSQSDSSSSTDNICLRGRNANCNSRSVRQLNRKHILSDFTDDSDPDDRILDKVRKKYKEIEKPVQIVDSQNTLNKTACDNRIVILTDSSEEDSEEDFIFMTNKKRLRMYGVSFEEPPNNSLSLLKYNRGPNIQNDSDGSSTDDNLFKINRYET